MRAKSIRRVLLTDYPALTNPGGIIVPSRVQTLRRVASERQAIWDVVPGFTTIELCDDLLTHITYSGSGTLCGFKGFFTFNEGITPRYLTKTVRGWNRYYNAWPWGFAYDRNEIRRLTKAWVYDDDSPLPDASAGGPAGIDTIWSGQAAYDPSDGCSLANNVQILRRTNGNPYAFLMAYGLGPAEETHDVADSYLGKVVYVWEPPGFYGNVVAGYNGINLLSPSHRDYFCLGLTALGNQLGSHTVFGNLLETLGQEQRLFDQLVLDGAEVSSTRTSELISYNDETGEFEGDISAFSFVKPEAANLLGVEYILIYSVNITVGMETSTQERSIAYTGTGMEDEVMTVQIDPVIGGSVMFYGECIVTQSATITWNDFEQIPFADRNKWFNEDAPPGPNWPSPIWITCGVTAVEDFQDKNPAISGQDTVLNGFESSGCWGGGWFLSNPGEPICWDDFQSKVPGVSSVIVWTGGIGFSGAGWFHIAETPLGYDDFQLQTPGLATAWANTEESTGWGGIGWFADDQQPIGYDDFQDNAPGVATTWTTGAGWGGDGWFADEP